MLNILVILPVYIGPHSPGHQSLPSPFPESELTSFTNGSFSFTQVLNGRNSSEFCHRFSSSLHRQYLQVHGFIYSVFQIYIVIHVLSPEFETHHQTSSDIFFQMVFQTFLTQLPQLNLLFPSSPNLFHGSCSQKMACQSTQLLRRQSQEIHMTLSSLSPTFSNRVLLFCFLNLSHHCCPFIPSSSHCSLSCSAVLCLIRLHISNCNPFCTLQPQGSIQSTYLIIPSPL